MLGNPAANAPEFRQAFVRKCHRLVGLAYFKLDRPSLRMAEETEITGELARAMEELLDNIPPPRGMRNLVVFDDPPQNTGRRRGRRRLRVDIEVRAIEVGPKPRFRFEAKRLTSNRSVRAYVGRDGLQMYISGEYAGEQDDAGMLGYVLTGEPKAWAAQLDAQLKSKPEEHAVCVGGEWTSCSLATEVPLTFRSAHNRVSIGRPLVVFHTLLDFSMRGRPRPAPE
jgi:hypothetical protein